MSFNLKPYGPLSLAVILLLTIAGFSACGGDSDVPTASKTPSNASQPSPAPDIDIKSLVSVNSNTYLAVDGIGGHPAKPNVPVVINAKTTPTFAVTGWAADGKAEAEAGGVIVNIDGNQNVLASFGQPRPDVAAHLKSPKYTNSGFIANIDASSLSKGRHTLSVRVVTSDRKGYFEPKDVYAIEIQ